MSESTYSGGGIGFCGLLAIVFIALKLTGHIGWSWWWVLYPLWVPFAYSMSIIAICAFGIGVCVLYEKLSGGRK